MKLQTAKNIVIGAVCAALAAGNIYQYTRAPGDPAQNIVFYELEPTPQNAYSIEQEKRSAAENDESTDRSGLIDLNSATQEELESLPGIGPVKAKAILEYRIVYGRFVTSEEIMEVHGIGQATYDKIKDRITVR